MSLRAAAIALAFVAGVALAQPAPPPGGPGAGKPRCDPVARIYVSPMGEPFRGDAPMAAWFAVADADHDGRLTLAEFTADAMRFFATIDLDHDGEVDPQEVLAYEANVAPEIKLYQRGAALPRSAKKDKRGYDEQPVGAGRYAQLNIPEPVASADADFNRGVDRAEFARAAADRFAKIARAGPMTLAALAPTPAQAEAAACAAKLARQAKAR